MSRTYRQRRGDRGEAAAAAYLRSKGFTILARDVNYGRMGQLDLVAAGQGRLWATEVKSRSHGAAYGGARFALSPGQQRRMTHCLLRYARDHDWRGGYGLLLVAVRLGDGEARVIGCEELAPYRVL